MGTNLENSKTKTIDKISNKVKNDEGFLLEYSNEIFYFLEKISIFNLIRKVKGNTTYKFVDGWVLGNLIVAILSTLIIYNLNNNSKVLIFIIFTYAVLRVFEVIIYQINVLLFHPYRAFKAGKNYEINSVPRMVLALLHNYVEIMFWYSTMVISIVVLSDGSAYSLPWSEYVKSNILSIATLDTSMIIDTLPKGYKFLSDIAFFEIISGIIMTIISLARFVGNLPGVNTQNTYDINN